MTTIEPKVKAATGGASAAALVCWVLTHYVFHGALPVPVEGLVDVVVPGAVALLGGYFTPHKAQPPTQAAIEYLRNYHNWMSTPTADQSPGDHHWYATGGSLPASSPTTPSPARPAVAEQPTENPTPKENPMSLLTQLEALAEDLRGKVIGKVGAEVSDEIHAAFDIFKGQSAQLLTQLGHDAQADATQIAADVAQVATDAAAAVAPAAEVTPAQVATPTEVPAPASSPEAAPEPPAAPTA